MQPMQMYFKIADVYIKIPIYNTNCSFNFIILVNVLLIAKWLTGRTQKCIKATFLNI